MMPDIPSYLYDHYKETVARNDRARKERDKFFALTTLLFILLFLLMSVPNQTMSTICSFFQKVVNVSISFDLNIIQSFIWILLYYCITNYFQRCIAIERAYPYIDSLEKSLHISRESSTYAEKYPMALNIVDATFKWILPLLFVLGASFKIFSELHSIENPVCTIIDAVCFVGIILITVTTVLFYHPIFSQKAKK